MLDILRARLQQGQRTVRFPDQAPVLPDRFRGCPELDPQKCAPDCRACLAACPTEAITQENGALRLDLGRCLFCMECVQACPTGALRFTQDYRLAARTRDDLLLKGATLRLAQALDDKTQRL